MQHSNRNVNVELNSFFTSKTTFIVSSKFCFFGYFSFVNFIAENIDTVIYRKYKRLNVRNLLYLQSELHKLKKKFEKLNAKDFEKKETYDLKVEHVVRY